MKNFLYSLCLVAVGFSCFAQTQQRVVNGVVYDTSKSKLWAYLSQHEKLGIMEPIPMQDSSDLYTKSCLYGSVGRVGRTSALYDIYRGYYEPDKITLQMQKTHEEFVKSVIILNCSYVDKLVTGEDAKFYCMRTTNFVTSDGTSLVAYDCGVQLTNSIPRIKEASPQLTKTNKPVPLK